MPIKLTKYGIREWLGCGIIAFGLLAINIYFSNAYQFAAPGLAISVLIVLVWLAIAAFFRDPKRTLPKDIDALLSPADGVVRDIELIKAPPIGCFDGKDALRVGIFLSVLDVHLNRAPCDVHIEFEQYKKGKFHDARNSKASKENESMTIGGIAKIEDKEFPIAIRQISGAIARRIVCPVKIGHSLCKGEIYGMIKFGSRTELYLPATPDIKVAVKIGDRLFAGSSIIARVIEEKVDEKVEMEESGKAN